MKNNLPLVSVLTPNYNHSRFLDTCIQSVLSQTYPNIEYTVLDNQSTDDSVAVAAKYINDGVRVNRNAINIMNTSYRVLINGLTSLNSKYAMLLPADDYLEPTFIEKCVSVMEKHPDVGYVHGEKDLITDEGEIIEFDEFYDRSFVAPGVEAMPIYMMTTVAHPAQGMFRISSFKQCGGYNMPIDHVNADKALWFYMSAVSDYAYIREKLSKVRIGIQTETSLTQRNFQHPMLLYLTLLEFVDYAERNGYPKVTERKEAAMLKLSTEFLSHAASALLENDKQLAERYLTFCKLISREIGSNDEYNNMQNMLMSGVYDSEELKTYIKLEAKRKRGYAPPDNFTEI